jgi:hypothetical protein
LWMPVWAGWVREQMKTVITTDASKISRLATLFPGPIFDLRPSRDGRLLRVRVGMYISEVSRQDALYLRDVMRVVRRKTFPLYVIGEEEEWQEMLKWADVLDPRGLGEMVGDPESEGEPEQV